MREGTIYVIKLVDAKESFVGGIPRSRRQQGRGRGIRIGKAERGNGEENPLILPNKG